MSTIDQPTARPEHSPGLGDRRFDRPDMLENLDRDDRVEHAIGERQPLCRRPDPIDPGRVGEHPRREVEPDHVRPGRLEMGREPPLAAAEVEDPLAFQVAESVDDRAEPVIVDR